MRKLSLVESKNTLLDITPGEALALQNVGQRLASKKEWWGQTGDVPDDRSVIRCTPAGGGLWQVRVSDAVGLISIGSLQLLVEPKIPTSHLLYLLSASGAFPRIDDQRGGAAAGKSLWELVATWFLSATERVVRRDLVRDYESATDALPAVHGKLHPLSTARSYYEGRLQFTCSFDDFSIDTPLNRVVRSAARTIAADASLGWTIRRRALALLARMEDVGDYQSSDAWPTLDRRTRHYADALTLARHILQSQARQLQHGSLEAWTFLIRTPEMVEAGILSLLQSAFGAHMISKRPIHLVGTSMTMNPDLVIGGSAAVADVKYKIAGAEWNRADLYQSVAFAVAARTHHAAVLTFLPPGAERAPSVRVGDISVCQITWPADPTHEPQVAKTALVDAFAGWMATVPLNHSPAILQVS